MTQLQSVAECSRSEFSTAPPDEQCAGVTKKACRETKRSKLFRGCEYQTVSVGTLFSTMPSTTPNKGIEQDSDFDIKKDESISDLRAMLQDYVKRAEKAANGSEQQISPLSKETSEGQRTALSMQTSEGQRTALSKQTSEGQRTALSMQTSEGQRTALSKETFHKQQSQPFQGIIQTIMYLTL